ncbi:MAG: Uma2 family endonuclease [Phycisphaerae bacterium]|nr:Uma2 family endonuclease [Phycisphaerae bacterium]
MSTRTLGSEVESSRYDGLRLSADEYYALADDGNRYELIEGVVVMSPSPSVRHQAAAFEIGLQLGMHLRLTRDGMVLTEIDVRLPGRSAKRESVYRPELIYIAAPRHKQVGPRVEIVPDLVVEVLSPESHARDRARKYADYEAAGVREYWLVDTVEKRCEFFRLVDGKYTRSEPVGDHFASEVVAGFKLDLALLRAAFELG